MSSKECIVCVILLLLSQSTEGIIDESVVFGTHDNRLFYSPKLQNWTDAVITPLEFVQSLVKINLTGTRSLNGIAGDIPTKHIATSDRGLKSILLYDFDEIKATPFHIGTSKDVGKLAIDWLGRNVYWIDTGYGWIAMKHLPENVNRIDSADPNFRIVVDKHLEKPIGIVVYPEKFYLFWTDIGGTPKIERSNLIGEERKVIIWQSIVTPTTLCIDQSAERLYWSDPDRRTIEYSDFDGNGRRILLSHSQLNFYGIAIFRESLIYTAPNSNRTGYVSLKENNEGDHIQSSISLQDVTFYDVIVYADEVQKIPSSALCEKVKECEQLCVHMEMDAGFTCLCDDGFDLSAGKNCIADEKVLERHIMFTNDKSICSVPISVLGLELSVFFMIHCDIITSDTIVTRFALDMANKLVFYTNGSTIFKQTAFKDDRTVLHETVGEITDMDFDWRTALLYWIELHDGNLYQIDINTKSISDDTLSDDEITNIAVDPHNWKVYWISKDSERTKSQYALNEWDVQTGTSTTIQTALLSKPSDVEYDRLKNRLLWNDNDGYVGMINIDGTSEKKINVATTGDERHAVTAYKNFIISTTAENRQFDMIYEPEDYMFPFDLHVAYDGPVQDVHVYETTLQALDLEPCEVNNGECEHICLPENEGKCACFLGYFLDLDKKSCRSAVLEEKYFVILDRVHKSLYQVDIETKAIHTIEISPDNLPAALAFDPVRKEVIWLDERTQAVKKMKLGTSEETAVLPGVDIRAAITVDVSSGNIYVISGGEITVVGPYLDSITVVDSTNTGVPLTDKIAVMPQSGLMAWFEDDSRIMVGNMDGTKIRPIKVTMSIPEDIAFDLEDENVLFWCDSLLDKIEKIDTKALSTTVIYEGRGLMPVAITIVGDIIYLVPWEQRKIVQINKNNGLQQKDVFESPLFGYIENFFISRRTITGHALCGNCNGGCSDLCLPIGRSKRCACSEGIRLTDDELTCQYAVDVCRKESYTSVPGLETLEQCCPNSQHAVCRPKCKSGYEKSSSAVQCKGGKWNITLNTICQAIDASEQSYIMYAAVGGGGVLLVIFVVVVICVCRRKSKRESSGKQHTYESHGNMAGYATADGVLSPDPPPRVPEPEVYDYLDEGNMMDASKQHVVVPPLEEETKKQTDRRSSTASGRYTRFPGENNGYLTASYTGRASREPHPDYYNDDDYLKPSSIDGGSLRESINSLSAYDHSYSARDWRSNDGYVSSRNSSNEQVYIGKNMSSARYSHDGRDRQDMTF